MKKGKILIVIANYYPKISKKLKKSSIEVLSKNFSYDEITVPGIFEIPVVISKNIDAYDAFVALGCVIKGKTSHFELITNAVTHAIMALSITYKKPIGNAIISCLNKGQASKRINKGAEASTAVSKVLLGKIIKK